MENTWIQELGSGSSSGPAYYGAQRPSSGMCAFHPHNSGICKDGSPAPQKGAPVPENTTGVLSNKMLRVQPEYFGFLFLEISRQEEEPLPLSKSDSSLLLGGGRAALTLMQTGQPYPAPRWSTWMPLGCPLPECSGKGQYNNSILTRPCDQKLRALRDKCLGHTSR